MKKKVTSILAALICITFVVAPCVCSAYSSNQTITSSTSFSGGLVGSWRSMLYDDIGLKHNFVSDYTQKWRTFPTKNGVLTNTSYSYSSWFSTNYGSRRKVTWSDVNTSAGKWRYTFEVSILGNECHDTSLVLFSGE